MKNKIIKVKSNKSAKKRFIITKNNLIKYASKGTQHCLSNKSRKKKRQANKTKYLQKCDAQKIIKLM